MVMLIDGPALAGLAPVLVAALSSTSMVLEETREVDVGVAAQCCCSTSAATVSPL
jgi:hypothetical protein